MGTTLTEETALVFECQGEQLVGILHKPANPMAVGIVPVIAGGPQYRAGVSRNMVEMARELSAAGVPVLRFDHRGLGDSSGTFLGFRHIRDDIQAAIDCLRREVPQVTEVVLWGGCDAASACMIHGADLSGVCSMVLGNPFVTTEKTQAAVQRQHYLRRLREGSFWRKLLRFEYKPGDYLRAAWRGFVARLRPGRGTKKAAAAAADSEDWIFHMREGLRRFEGPVLFLMSGKSLVSKEFDDLVGRDRDWQKICNRGHYRRIDLPEADQTFSGADSRERVNRALREWLQQMNERVAGS
ncbi:MAG: hydrolase 1, exosortase A system-associated [Halioglobus sp.]|nr:hydrolase 1, exosortase A system-associated [Halioglobus sp.]